MFLLVKLIQKHLQLLRISIRRYVPEIYHSDTRIALVYDNKKCRGPAFCAIECPCINGSNQYFIIEFSFCSFEVDLLNEKDSLCFKYITKSFTSCTKTHK